MPGTTYSSREQLFFCAFLNPSREYLTLKYLIKFPNFIVAICVVESISRERAEEWQKLQMMLMWVWYVLNVWNNSSTQENFLIVAIAFVKLVLLAI